MGGDAPHPSARSGQALNPLPQGERIESGTNYVILLTLLSDEVELLVGVP